MTDFPLWAERLYNRPLALDRFKNEVLCEFAQTRITGERPKKLTAATLDRADLDPERIEANEGFATFQGPNGVRRCFAAYGDIAVIPVRGSLVHRGGWLDAESGLVGYDFLLRQARAASTDDSITGMMLPFDSGGGECAGMFAAAEELASMAKAEGGKPIYAYLDERACSAAYVLASACDKIMGRREVMGGSIAAIINMVDKSKMYEKAGLEPIVIRAGWADRKARWSGVEPVDKETISRLEEIVDEASEQVVEFVAAMRGDRGVTAKSLKDLRGEVFTGNDLLKFGLIDRIASEREAWDALIAEARSA
ncbi:S49 family peptidase [Sphingobium lactosutens]|jgi:capsid assembly protease|uniref:S49 family peptidase n=1 Tax=Sphingobium lactosutens TaxID=522773 RepID=UPI001D17EA53|nr:S49 family peptidase [Sphingobium lactosutens]MCC4258020.1 S49 family peptidase [Sphingobium lactosutens]|tara:strand:+ start:24805 stop:25731 length:927 start_codon:yes stop_codon:yes gene_type:complete